MTVHLSQRGETAARRLDLERGVGLLLEKLVEALGYQRAFVVLLNTEERTVEHVVGVNIPAAVLQGLRTALSERSPLFESLSSGKVVRVDDIAHDPRIVPAMQSFYVEAAMPAWAAVPLLPASAVLVVSKGRPITEAEINDLFPYTGQLAASLTRYQEERLWPEETSRSLDNEWLHRMLDTVTDPLVLTDEENNILLQNAHAQRLFKGTEDDSPGKLRAIELNNFLLSAALSSFTLDQGAAMARELTLVEPEDGSEILCEFICHPVSLSQTGERRLATVIKDVTALRQTGEELRHSLQELQRTSQEARLEGERLRTILDNVPDPIVVAGPGNEILLMNPPAERLLRIDEELRHRSPGSWANETKLTSFLFQFSLEPTDRRQGELELVDPVTNKSVTMSATVARARTDMGQAIASVCVLHNLEQARELERRRLEQQLFESEKLAAVGRLAAAVAHEINNPLESIKNSLYVVVPHVAKESADRRLLEIAKTETDRVSRIIRQMLGLYRRDQDRALIDLNQVIEECLAVLEPQLTRRRIVLHRSLERRLPHVMGVGDQLKQVFLNLLINAQEAMEKGGELRVETRLSKPGDAELVPAEYVLAEVHDTGPGIPEEHLHRIFDPFFSTKREGGTGIGLWVSSDIVHQHQGQLKVKTRVGRGTTFTVALPKGSEHGKSDPPSHRR